MIEIIREVKELSNSSSIMNLDHRVGVHTGSVIAGIIGSKVVRYDIFGESVLITHEIEGNGEVGEVCISEDTKRLLELNAEFTRCHRYEYVKTIRIDKIRTDK